jgi:hypothetical protein
MRLRTLTGRDQAVSAFSAILLRLCDNVGSPGAALVDAGGETVDYAGTVDPYEIRVAAAEAQLLLSVVRTSSLWRDTHEVLIRGSSRSFAIIVVDEGYSIVIQLLPYCFSVSERALAEAVREICLEAGLLIPPWYRDSERWSRVEVRAARGEKRRPTAIWFAGQWCPVEVLGRYRDDDLGRGDVGYRARLTSGAEFNLVREQLGRWYAEDLPT